MYPFLGYPKLGYRRNGNRQEGRPLSRRYHSRLLGGAMEHHRSNCLLIWMLLCSVSACARNNLYKQWDTTFESAVRGGRSRYTKADVSLLLGTSPSRCEAIESTRPTIGIVFDSTSTRILLVSPRTPADSVGLKAGSFIASIAGEPTPTAAALRRAFSERTTLGVPLVIETDRGTFSPVPRLADEEQCYWEVVGGDIKRSGAGVSVVPGMGAVGRAGSAAYSRFYRLTGRFFNGVLTRFASNWTY